MPENKGELINSRNEGEKPVDDLHKIIKGILKKDEDLLVQERLDSVLKQIPKDPKELEELERHFFYDAFGVRTKNALEGYAWGKPGQVAERIDSLEKLLMNTPRQLLQRQGFGKLCLKDVRCNLAKKGIFLMEDDIESVKKDYPDFTL